MFSKTKLKGKKRYCMSCLQSFSTEEILNNQGKRLLINGCQALNYKSGLIEFTNYNKQIPILFKVYAEQNAFWKELK